MCNFVVVFDRSLISMNCCNTTLFRYLSTFFILDVASTIPFQGLAYLATGEVKEGVAYSVLGIFRLWRLRKVKQFFTR